MKKNKLLYITPIILLCLFISPTNKLLKSNFELTKLTGSTNKFVNNKLLIDNEEYNQKLPSTLNKTPKTNHNNQNANTLSLNELAKMIYSGDSINQHVALEYLPNYGIKSLQLLLYLINSNSDFTVKEVALLVLSGIDPTISTPILTSLHSNSELSDFINSLGALPSKQAYYSSPYKTDLSLFDKEEYYHIKTLLTSPDIKKRESAIDQIILLNDETNIDLLHLVIDKDKSVVIRNKAFESAIKHFPEQSNDWINLMLSDSSSVLQTKAVNMINSYNENIEQFIPALLQILFNDSNDNLKSEVRRKLFQAGFNKVISTVNETKRSELNNNN